MDHEVIKVKGIRILGPFEVDQFLAAIPKDHHKTMFEVLLWSGIRYVELQRLHEHPEWYWPNRRNIHLPEQAQKKAKRRQLERDIHPIPPQLESIMRYFFKGPKPPSRQAWDQNMGRWARLAGMKPEGFSSKTTRKTIESWMVTAGIPVTTICLRQGHDSVTSMRHYQGLPFTDAEKREIKKRLAGWIE